MNCGLILLWVGRISLWGNEFDNMGNVSTIASCKQNDTANNALIYMSSTRKIRIKGVNCRNWINGEAGAIWSHIENFFALWTYNRWAVNSVNNYWHRWIEILSYFCWIQVNAVPKNSWHLPWNWLGCVLGLMSWRGPTRLDLMNRTRNRQHRGNV